MSQQTHEEVRPVAGNTSAAPRPTLRVRRSNERGFADHGWLKSFHTFSFAGYHDPNHMGFQALRVINEDRVAPGQGFGTHGHQDMEIISYSLEGSIEHKDSIGTGSIIRPGDVQRMSAGTGVRHSEFNPSKSDSAHFLQIWIVPDRRGYAPSYEQKTFPTEQRRGNLRLVASQDGRDGSVTVHQDVNLYAGSFNLGEKARFELTNGRKAWLHVARGSVEVNDLRLEAGDAVAVESPGPLLITGKDAGEVLLFDLA